MKIFIRKVLMLTGMIICCQYASATVKLKIDYGQVSGYTDGQTAFIDCTAGTSINVVAYLNDQMAAYNTSDWQSSANYSFTVGTIPDHITLTTDSNMSNDGFVAVNVAGTVVKVFITRRPTPTLTIAPTLCNAGQAADYSLTLNFYGQSSANIIWQTTGGVTVNNSSSYIVYDNTISRANIKHNSYGTLTVYGEIVGCNNLQTKPIIKYIGTPSTNELIFNSSPTFWGSICTGEYYYLQLANPLPIDQYSFNWNKLEGGENFMYSPSGNTCGLTGISANAPSYGIIELTVTNMVCGTTSTVNRDFYIENCSGSFRVMTNPVSDKIITEFEPVSDINYLPKSLTLSNERNGAVKEIKLHDRYSREAAKKGLRLELDVKDIPKDTYYLQATYDDGRIQSKRIIVQ